MQAKQNKCLAERLEKLGEIPEGFFFDSHTAWSGIEQRLEPPVLRSTYHRYVIAACTISVAMALYLLIPGKGTQELLPQAENTVQPEIKPVRQSSAISVPRQKQTRNLVTKALRQDPDLTQKEEPVPAPDIVLPDHPQQTERIMTVPAMLLPAHQVAGQKPKPPVKRYRIVHLEDLYTSPPPVFTTQTEEKKPFFSVPEKEPERTRTTLAPEPGTVRVLGFRIRPQTNTITLDH